MGKRERPPANGSGSMLAERGDEKSARRPRKTAKPAPSKKRASESREGLAPKNRASESREGLAPKKRASESREGLARRAPKRRSDARDSRDDVDPPPARPIGLFLAGAGALVALGVVGALALSGGKGATPAPTPEVATADEAAAPNTAGRELRGRVDALRRALSSLPPDEKERGAELTRLERGLATLRREPGAKALERELAGIESQIALEVGYLEEAERPSKPAPARQPKKAPDAPVALTAPPPAESASEQPPARETAPAEPPPAPSPAQPEKAKAGDSSAPGGTTTQKELDALEKELGRLELLDEVFQKWDAKDRKGMIPAAAKVESVAPGTPEAAVAGGLRADLEGRFLDTVKQLREKGALEVGGFRAAEALVRALFATMRYEEARAALEGLPEHQAKVWGSLIDGPIRAAYPLAAPACEALTPEGRYRVITDLGLAPGYLPQLEAKLKATPEAERPKLLAKAQKSHKGLHELTDVMDKAIKAYMKLLAVDEAPQVFPTVFVLQDRAQFDKFSASLDIHGVENALGYYVPSFRVMVFYDQPEGRVPGRALSRGTLQVLLHETFHQWLHLQIEDAPRWFDEGMAEYFGIGDMTSSGLRYGLVPTMHPSRLDNIREAFGGLHSPPLPLRELVRADRATFYGAGAPIYYAQAWSFVHYLGSTTKGQKLLRNYFHALRRGLELEAAYQEVFASVDLEGMEKDWRQYVGSLN